ncbi:uncharacterized protein LOC130678429 isoform X2 [Microplitis mediator]|uniref:uncharacterized protein LOC130678429 isoform X2 n=1 Tax=Microplitis mediator TaxID=375433 RepID=UPI002556E042|nr:uncharacterized protein LOC130678429 isoform X2 [Microplitis mediator]
MPNLSDITCEFSDDDSSDVLADHQSKFIVVGRKPRIHTLKKKRHLIQKLFTREIGGCLSQYKNDVQGRIFETIPSWGYLPLHQVIPMSAIQAGHIVMGLTQCGQFILTYTYNLDLRGIGSLYKYRLHWWTFSPKKLARKVAEIVLFGNYTINKELEIVIAQWPMEKNKIVIHGLHSDWELTQTTARGYLTFTTLPSLANCKDCAKLAASYEEEANWDGCRRCNCLFHGLTVHTTYEVISPYPRFRASVCLNYWNHVVINTGNFLHVLTVQLHAPKKNNYRTYEKQNAVSNIVKNDVSGVEKLDDMRTAYHIHSTDAGTSKAFYELSLNSNYTHDQEFLIEKKKFSDEISTYESSNCKLNDSFNTKACQCLDSVECLCIYKKNVVNTPQQRSILVRDKISEDFSEDVSQELSCNNDLIPMVDHSSYSTKLIPQSSSTDLKKSESLFTSSADIFRTQTFETASGCYKNERLSSLPPGMSEDDKKVSYFTTINSPLRTLLQSSPGIHISHKLKEEAEKAYEFVDDTQETCEKLSSFRKRRLADKKYEFCEETEDTENIVPFKYIRNQLEFDHSSVCWMPSKIISPAHTTIKWHHSKRGNNDIDDIASNQNILSSFQPLESVKKSVLRLISQNQLHSIENSHNRIHTQYDCSSQDDPVSTSNFVFPYPIIKCTNHFKRSYIESDDEMISVITEVEDDETGENVSYQCVLPIDVHGSGYVRMQMISNNKAEKLMLPYVSINQFSFDIETFSHHIAEWICKKFKKKYWHCIDYDIEIVEVCAISGDIICMLMMKIEASEYSMKAIGSQERRSYMTGCQFMWNIDANQYKIISIFPVTELSEESNTGVVKEWSPTWNPTRNFISSLRKTIKQIYARPVRYIHHSAGFSDSLSRIIDMDNLTEFYLTKIPEDNGLY